MPGSDALASAGRGLAWRLVHRAWRTAQQAGAITAGTPACRWFAGFGPGSIIAFPAGTLYGEKWIEIGAGAMIAAQSRCPRAWCPAMSSATRRCCGSGTGA